MKNPEYKYLKYNINNYISTLFINREKYLNALSKDIIVELIDFYNWVDNNKNIKVIIMTGAGDKAFVAGADIKEMSRLDLSKSKSYAALGQKLTLIIENLSKPVIAAINGYALGGGCEIAIACHIRYASTNSKFAQPEVGLGLIAGFGGTQRLSRLIGKGMALELLLSGKMINAEEALRIKLVNKIIDNNILLEECYVLADKIKNNSPIAIRHTIKAVNQGESMDIEEALDVESDLFSKVFHSSDCREGLKAFLNKTKPEFLGN